MDVKLPIVSKPAQATLFFERMHGKLVQDKYSVDRFTLGAYEGGFFDFSVWRYAAIGHYWEYPPQGG